MKYDESKFQRVKDSLDGKRVLVAFSGGVDSAALAHVAKNSAKETVLLTVDSITFPKTELDHARSVADEIGIKMRVIKVDELANQDLVKNPVDRCYHCKKELSTVWLSAAEELGMDVVVDGTNASDMLEHRPGALALEQAGIRSPFRETGISKAEIRAYAMDVGLSVADRPSMACLSSRFPYGTEITEDRVRQVNKVESEVKVLFGVDCVRARYHGDLVRIEVGRDEREKLFDIDKMDKIHELARESGFKYVAFDVLGYRTGAMNEVLGVDV